MKYRFTMQECDNCPKCGKPIEWNLMFSDEECYSAFCEKCNINYSSKQSSNFQVMDDRE